jgi:phenylpropionate dioxygenase-like ring-hydroxylating dioxygenase large terminal subunit
VEAVSGGVPSLPAELVHVARREVSLRVLSDTQVYEQEMSHIFGHSWLFLAHESELPRRGDFVVRRMGSDQVIVCRQSDDSISVLLNMCRHRGMQVCRTEVGNTSRFVCPYHGWVYNAGGAFMGAPIPRERMHGEILDRSDLGLINARVGRLHGLIFATWDQKQCPLEDYLGEIAPYLRIMLGKSANGQRVLGPPQRAIVEANWKCAAEQFAGDDFHSLSLHRSLREMQLADETPERRAQEEAERASGARNRHVDVSVPQGHTVMCFPKSGFDLTTGRPTPGVTAVARLREMPPAGVSASRVEEVIGRFDADALDIMAFCPPQTGFVFPNFGMVQAPYSSGAFTCLHTFLPRSAGRFEFMTWFLSEKDAEEDDRRKTAQVSVGYLGSSGIIEQDDSEVWPSMQRVAEGHMGSRGTLKYQAYLGPSKPPRWPGGGTVYAGFSKDDNQWNFWLRWRELMAHAERV